MAKNRLHRATYEGAGVQWEAYGDDAKEARKTLVAMIEDHNRTFPDNAIDLNWVRDDAHVYSIGSGDGYADGERYRFKRRRNVVNADQMVRRLMRGGGR